MLYFLIRILTASLPFSIALADTSNTWTEDTSLPSSLFTIPSVDHSTARPNPPFKGILTLYHAAKKIAPQLRIQKMGLAEQLAKKDQANSKLYPKITLGGGASNRHYQYQPTDQSPDNAGKYFEKKLELRLQQSLFSYGLRDTIEAYQLNTHLAEKNIEQEETRLIINVAQAVLNTVAGFDDWQQKQAQWQALKKRFQLTKRRFELGQASEMEVQEVQAQLSHAYSLRLQAKNQWSLAQLALSELTGIESLPHWQWKQQPITLPPLPHEKLLYSAAARNHKRLQALQLQIAAQQKLKAASENAYYPNVSLSAGYTPSFSKGFQSPLVTPAKNASRHSEVYDIGLYFEWNLFSGGETEAKQREYQAKLGKAQAQLDQWLRNLKTKARQTLQQVRYTQAQQNAAALAVEAAQQAKIAVQRGYTLGIRDIYEVLNSEQRTLETRQYYNLTRVSLLHAYLQVLQLAGSLSPKDLAFLDQWLILRRNITPSQ